MLHARILTLAMPDPPLCHPHHLLLHPPTISQRFSAAESDDNDVESAPLSASYTRLPNEESVEESVPVTEGEAIATAPIALSMQDKWKLAKPMLTKYMLPLCEWDHKFTGDV